MGRKKEKATRFFSDGKRDGLIGGDRTEAASTRLSTGRRPSESIERIGLTTTIETQSGGCRVKRGWSRRMEEEEEGRADGLGIYHFVAKVA